MSKKNTITIPASGTTLDIPLSKLKKSPRNARTMPHPKADIEALAASIHVHGVLQSPVVEPELKDGQPTGFYLVTIGEGRRLAQLLRAKRKQISKSEPIRCLVETTSNALEISLAENAIRSPMHPADQFEAFYAMHTEHGMNAEDIAARFGVTAAVVKQRLKLAAISPVLMKAYRDEELSLDQLTAFAFTDDHAKQERVWADLGEHCDRGDILEIINGENVAADDPRAVFVGLEAYEAAGGAVLRDLFDDQHQGFLTDAGLLNQLVEDKLEQVAETVRAEGWKWVEVLPRYDHAAVADMRRIYGDTPELSEETESRIDALRDELEAMEEYDAEAVQKLEDEIEVLQGTEQYEPSDVARGGAVIAVGCEGEARIERGFIRPEDDTDRATAETPVAKAGRPPIPDSLRAELTAHRTSALRNALAQQPEAALLTVLHALAEQAFYPGRGTSCLRLILHQVHLQPVAKGIDETTPEKEIDARHAAWAKRLPGEQADLWMFLGTLSLAEQLDLMAHCAALSLDTIERPKQNRRHNGDAVASCIGFDMAAAWEPTPENYLGRVSKERILEAVREGVSSEAAANLATMKKSAMAQAAAQRLRGTHWLPPVLRPAVPGGAMDEERTAA